MKRFSMLIAVCALLAVVGGCNANSAYMGNTVAVQTPTLKLTSAQATVIAGNALRALSDGNRRAYMRGMNESLQDVLSEEGFKALRDKTLSQSGRFVSVAAATMIATRTPGYVKWVCTCNFEKEQVQVEMIFKQDGNQILSTNFASIQ